MIYLLLFRLNRISKYPNLYIVSKNGNNIQKGGYKNGYKSNEKYCCFERFAI